MMKVLIQEKYYPYLLLAGMLAFLVFKIPQLGLPYYWDEAYPYSYAIHHLYQYGPSLFPNSVPADWSTGHPLLFYFLEAGWMTIFGNSFIAARCFPLLLSLLLILLTYRIGKRLFSPVVGLSAALLLICQSVFLAQSTFVLPETLLSLLALAALDAYLSEKKLLYLVFAGLLVLTKESGAVLALLIPVFDLVFHQERSWRRTLFWCLPLLVMAGYYGLQKLQLGWFLYPRHLGYVSFDLSRSLNLFLHGYGAFVWVYFGRIFITLLLAAGLTGLLIKRKSIAVQHQRALLLFGMFILGLWSFSSINFYSPRYLLAVFAPLLLIFSYSWWELWKQQNTPVLITTLLLCGSSLFYSLHVKNDSDHNLGFENAVRVQQKALAYVAQQHPANSHIYTHFLISKALQEPHIGYVKTPFPQVYTAWNDSINLIIVASNEAGLVPQQHLNQPGFIQDSTFRDEHSWVRIWRRSP